MKSSPIISIILPSYNRAHILVRAIESIMNQTFQDFEVIVVDDGSTDDTEEKVRSIKDKRIKYIRHEVNKGPAAARNTGISYASGSYIAFQDSDDEWQSEKLERQISIFHKAGEDVGVVYTGFWRIFSDRKVYYPSEKIKNKNGDIHYELLNGNFIGMPTVMIKRECFNKVGLFDEALPPLEDWELFIRISRFYKFLLINEPLVLEYESNDSISKNRSSNIKSLRLIIEKHQEDFLKNPKALSRYYFEIGDYLFRSGQIKDGRFYLKKAFYLRPVRSKPLFAWLLSFAGEEIYKGLL